MVTVCWPLNNVPARSEPQILPRVAGTGLLGLGPLVVSLR